MAVTSHSSWSSDLSSSSSVSTEDCDSESSDEGQLIQASKKISEHSNISVEEGVLSVMNLFIKEKLKKSLIGDIYKIVLQVLPKEHTCPNHSTCYLIKKGYQSSFSAKDLFLVQSVPISLLVKKLLSVHCVGPVDVANFFSCLC